MPSPFPGMDPYLEGPLWADVHQALAYQFRRQLAPMLQPHYAVRLAVSIINDLTPAHELGIMYPDVEILRPRESAEGLRGLPSPVAIAPAPLSIEVALPTQVRMVSVEVRDAEKNTLVTSIEILSPSNKREPGLSAYVAKRDELRMADVHLLELDLLRRGTRPWPNTALPASPYLATLLRARHIRAEVWPIELRRSLPVLPVPLRAPDPDVPLDLQTALDTIYDEAAYQITLNYDADPPPPPLAAEDTDWAAACVREWRAHQPQ